MASIIKMFSLNFLATARKQEAQNSMGYLHVIRLTGGGKAPKFYLRNWTHFKTMQQQQCYISYMYVVMLVPVFSSRASKKQVLQFSNLI